MTKRIPWIMVSIFSVMVLAYCNLSQSLGLRIETNSPRPYSEGQVIKISYFIRNTGGRGIGGTASVTSDKTSVTCPALNTIGDFDNTLDRTEEIECTGDYSVTGPDINAKAIQNTASATVGGVVSSPVTASLPTDPNPLLASPLKLTTSANPASYGQTGQEITFSYVIQNTGTGNLGPSQFTVSDSLIGAIPFNCGLANTTLDPNATVNCTAKYTIKETDMTAMSITNIATASGGGATPSASASTTVSRNVMTMALTTTANPTIYSQTGQKITFSYIIKNIQTGNLGPAQFTLKDALISNNPFNCGPANTTLAPNATVSCTAEYTIKDTDLTAASITNIATASDGVSGSSSPSSVTITKTNDTSHQVVQGEWLWQIARCYGVNPNTLIADNRVQVPNPRMLKEGTVLTVRNPGTYSKYFGPPCVEKYAVQSGDTWNTIAQKYNADPVILQMANASKTLSAGTVVNVPRNSASGNSAPSTQVRSLILTTTANPTTYEQAGQKIIFTYVIRNSGTVNLGPDQFRVSDTLLSASQFACGAGNTSLTPNATVTCSAEYTITQNDMTAVSITNIATASGGGATPSPAASTTVNRVARTLSLTTTANPTTYEAAGQGITFTYVIRNSGTVNLGPDQFRVADSLIGATSIPCGAANTTLTPNTTVTCTATYTTTPNDMTAVSITNIATALGGGAATSPAASATVNRAVRSLSLITTANPTTYNQAEQRITFTYEIKNTGTITLGPTQFTVSDSLISALPLNCGAGNTTLAPNAVVTCQVTYAITQNDMTAVSVTNIATASGGGAGPTAPASATVTRQ